LRVCAKPFSRSGFGGVFCFAQTRKGKTAIFRYAYSAMHTFLGYRLEGFHGIGCCLPAVFGTGVAFPVRTVSAGRAFIGWNNGRQCGLYGPTAVIFSPNVSRGWLLEEHL